MFNHTRIAGRLSLFLAFLLLRCEGKCFTFAVNGGLRRIASTAPNSSAGRQTIQFSNLLMLDLIQPFVNLPLVAFNAGDSVWNSFGGLCRNTLHTISAISTLRFIVDTVVDVILSQIVLAI